MFEKRLGVCCIKVGCARDLDEICRGLKQADQGTHDKAFDLARGDAFPPGASVVIPVGTYALNIVAIAASLLDRMGRRERNAFVIEQLSRQGAWFFASGSIMPGDAMIVEFLLHRIPGGLFDNGRVEPRIGDLFVADAANVNGVLQQEVEVPVGERVTGLAA